MPGKSPNEAAPNTITDTVKAMLRQLYRPFFFLLLLIMICAFLAQYMTDSETLAEYEKRQAANKAQTETVGDAPAQTDMNATDTDNSVISASPN